MKRTIVSTILASSLGLGSVAAIADSHGMDAMQLAEEKKCTACHNSTEDVPRAPAFSSISQRYTMGEYDRLVEVVMKGGEDHWGSAKMPETGMRPEVSREEAEKLVKWILNMKEKDM